MNDSPVVANTYDSEEREALQLRKATLLTALKAAGIASVEIAYNGEGDSGQIEELAVFDEAGAIQTAKLSTEIEPGQTLAALIDDIAWDVIQAYHDGFENDDGGFGKITIDVAAGTVTLDHNDRVINFANTTTEV